MSHHKMGEICPIVNESYMSSITNEFVQMCPIKFESVKACLPTK